jgi:hypothetical protein
LLDIRSPGVSGPGHGSALCAIVGVVARVRAAKALAEASKAWSNFQRRGSVLSFRSWRARHPGTVRTADTTKPSIA